MIMMVRMHNVDSSYADPEFFFPEERGSEGKFSFDVVTVKYHN